MISRILYICVLFALTVAGRWCVDYFAIPLPAPLLGLAVLFVALTALNGVPEGLIWASRLLLKYLSLFFIPITVAVITFKSQLAAHWQIITFTLIASTLISLLLTAIITKHLLIRLPHKNQEEARRR